MVVGWLVAGYLEFLAFRTLRSPRPNERLFTLFFGEFGLWLYTFEGHRYRFWALIAFIAGAAITITLAIALGNVGGRAGLPHAGGAPVQTPDGAHGMAGFIIGTVAGQFAGAWAYWRILGKSEVPSEREFGAAWAAGLVTTVVASAVYIPLGVQTWLGGEGTSWSESVFLGVGMGICQGTLFRGKLLRPPRPTRSQ